MHDEPEVEMKTYRATVGAYVRSYADFTFEAANNEEAKAAAIAHYKADGDDIMFQETDWTNVALPSIVVLESVDDDDTFMIEGIDFALNETDARDMHSQKLLNLVELVAAGNTELAALETSARDLLAKIKTATPAQAA